MSYTTSQLTDLELIASDAAILVAALSSLKRGEFPSLAEDEATQAMEALLPRLVESGHMAPYTRNDGTVGL